jgi:hypothetical protein
MEVLIFTSLFIALLLSAYFAIKVYHTFQYKNKLAPFFAVITFLLSGVVLMGLIMLIVFSNANISR